MAIAFDAFSQAKVAATNATLSFSHTTAGSNRYLVVGFVNQNTGSITSVTYNGVAMTLIDSQSDTNSIVYLYGLANPASGANTVAITRGTTTNNLFGYAYSLTGAQQTTPQDAKTKGTATSVASSTGTLTTVANNCWCVMQSYADNGGMAPSTNSTEKSTPEGAGAADIVAFFDNSSVAPITPAGSTSMTFTGTNGTLSYVMASIAPSGVAVDTSKFLQLF